MLENQINTETLNFSFNGNNSKPTEFVVRLTLFTYLPVPFQPICETAICIQIAYLQLASN